MAKARAHPERIPDYAFDVHMVGGRRQGATQRDLFNTERAAWKPRQSGLFDLDVEKM